MHLGGISLECQWWLFFPFAPIFCDGKNYSPPWQISIGSICREQECREQNEQRELDGCKAQHEAASWFDLHSLHCMNCQSLLVHWQRKRCENTQKETAVFQEIPSDVILLFLFVSPKHPSKICNIDLENVAAQIKRLHLGDECDTGCTSCEIKTFCSDFFFSADRRKWDETQRLMKTGPFCLGLLKEKDEWGTPLCLLSLLNPPITS